jgi:hypothetical protein
MGCPQHLPSSGIWQLAVQFEKKTGFSQQACQTSHCLSLSPSNGRVLPILILPIAPRGADLFPAKSPR